MKKTVYVLIALIFALSVTGCASETASAVPESPASETVTSSVSDTAASVSEHIETVLDDSTNDQTEVALAEEDATDEAILVVVFSATGNTKRVAEKIAEFENADIYEIVPKELYTEADLNYNDSKSRSTIEQNDPSSRPEIGSDPIDISGYTKIYIGYPIWWAIEPRIMDTFVESYDFTGKTVIPFCTSGSSGIGKSGTNLEALAGTGNWLSGKRFMSAVTDEKLKEWIDSIE